MLGQLLVVISIAAGLFTVAMYYFTLKGYENTLVLARRGYYLMTGTIMAASVVLFYLIMNHNYQYDYVFNYSSSDLSLGLLASTFFAGQEGSFLLWLLINALLGLVIIKRHQNDSQYESSVMIIYTLLCVFLAVLISAPLKDPFAQLWAETNYLASQYFNKSILSLPILQDFIFTKNGDPTQFIKVGPELKTALLQSGISVDNFIIAGKGLNPLLHNFWMQIHPPLLFVGFALAAVPYAYAVASTIRNEYKTWISESLPWLAIGMMVLGAAIMIGGYWAYGVLGWGGYWGWDPVENSSLVPWIIGVALIHTITIQKQSANRKTDGRFAKTNIVLALLTFVSVLYSTFLTRSGILSDSSVHSFVDPGMLTYTFLSGFILTFLLIGCVAVYKRWSAINSDASDYKIFSREAGLFYGSAILLGMAIIISVGTSSPIFGTSVEIEFYNMMNLPLAIGVSALIGLAVYLNWHSNSGTEIAKKLTGSFVGAIALSAALIGLFGISEPLHILFILASTFALTTNIILLSGKNKVGLIASGGKIAHIGIAVFFIGVVMNGTMKNSHEVKLIKDVPQAVFNKNLVFTSITPFQGGKKYKFDISISDGKSSYTASPVMYISDFNGSLMREPDILEGWSTDFYISPLSYEEGSQQQQEQSGDITLTKNTPFQFSDLELVFKKFLYSENDMSAMMNGGDFSFGAEVEVKGPEGETFTAKPTIKTVNGINEYVKSEIPELGISLTMTKMDASGIVNISIEGRETENKTVSSPEVLMVEISIEPFINLVWLGTVLISFGFTLVYFRRKQELSININEGN